MLFSGDVWLEGGGYASIVDGSVMVKRLKVKNAWRFRAAHLGRQLAKSDMRNSWPVFGGDVCMRAPCRYLLPLVTNVANSARLQEECDVLVLRISRVAKGNVNFGEYTCPTRESKDAQP